jgi:tetratricopeptide (TPR) repeat protein
VWSYQVIAEIFIDTNKYDLAIQIYERAFEKMRYESFGYELADLHCNYAVLLRALNKNEEAMKHFSNAQEYAEKIIRKNPQSAPAYTQLGNIFAEKGNFKKAVDCFQKAVDLEPADLRNHIDLVQALTASGQTNLAIKKIWQD